MFKVRRVPASALAIAALFMTNSGLALAQAAKPEAAASAAAVVPRMIRFSGEVDGQGSEPASVSLTFTIYAEALGGSALWAETQTVSLDAAGKYSVLLGSSSPDGLPMELFVTNAARWVGVRAGEGEEQPRRLIVSVPYALKASDAETFGGRAPGDYVLASALSETASAMRLSAIAPEDSAAINNGATNGTANFIAKFDSASTVVNSGIFESAGKVGLNTTLPQQTLQLGGGGLAFEVNQGSYLTNKDYAIMYSSLNSGGAFPFNSNDHMIIQGRTSAAQDIVFATGSPTPIVTAVFRGNGSVTMNRLGINSPAPSQSMQLGAGGLAFEVNQPAYLTNKDYAIMYSSLNGAGAYPFNGNDHMIIQARSSAPQDIVFATGSPTPANTLVLKGSGNVGVGVNSPSVKLEVNANDGLQAIRANQAGAGSGGFSVGSPGTTAILGDATNSTGVTIGVQGIASADKSRAVVGKSLATSGDNMGVFGVALSSNGTGIWGEATSTATSNAPVGVYGTAVSGVGTGVWGEATATSGDARGVFGRSSSSGGTGVYGEVTAGSGTNVGVYGKISSSGGAAAMFDNTATGNIIVGRTGPSNAPSNVFRVATTGQVFGASFNTSGADFAESVSVREEKSAYQPGDVMSVDTEGVRRFTKSSTPYSTLVAGIYSTKPGILATPHTGVDDQRPVKEEIPLAMVGIVPCKVSNENGAIKAGDLLVSSSTPGYAMKGTDRNRMTGAVIGKALQSMSGTTGVIEVLVSLQ